MKRVHFEWNPICILLCINKTVSMQQIIDFLCILGKSTLERDKKGREEGKLEKGTRIAVQSQIQSLPNLNLCRFGVQTCGKTCQGFLLFFLMKFGTTLSNALHPEWKFY
jgi:hypothetical protein